MITKISTILLLLLLFLLPTYAQITPSTIRLDAEAPAGIIVASASASQGQSGVNGYYYWVVSRFNSGRVIPVNPATILNIKAPSVTNVVTISWNNNGANTWDVLRTTTNQFPGSCAGCLVATGLVTNSTTDTGLALGAYVFTGQATNATSITKLNNIDYSLARVINTITWQFPQICFDDGTCQSTAGGGGGGVLLQTNTVNNANQSKLNLINGANISLTADGVGGVTVANTYAPNANYVTAAGALTTNLPVIGSGAKAVSVGTISGNTTKFVTSTGALVNGNCASWDANGNVIDAGAPCSSGSGTITQVQDSGSGTIVVTNPNGPIVGLDVDPANVVTPGYDNTFTGQNKFNIQRMTITLANDVTTGTTLNQVACKSSAGDAINCPTSATSSDVIGVVVAGAGVSGSATIAKIGIGISCVTDGGTTAGHYITLSTTIAGNCHDIGTAPSIFLGFINSTNAGANTYSIELAVSNGGSGGTFDAVTGASTLTIAGYIPKVSAAGAINPSNIYQVGSNVSIGVTSNVDTLDLGGGSMHAVGIDLGAGPSTKSHGILSYTSSIMRLSAGNGSAGTFNFRGNNYNNDYASLLSPGVLELMGGGIKLTGDVQPTCDSTKRGYIWFVAGGAGVKDTLNVCAKDAADAYAWRTIY